MSPSRRALPEPVSHDDRASPASPVSLAAHLALLFVLGCILLLAAGPILTDDFWWHLAMGEAYASGGPWLAADPLLHTAHASGPVQHEWLFGVLVHTLEGLGGFHGVRFFHALAVLAIAGLAYSVFRRETRVASRLSPLVALATTLFLTLAWWRLMQARPDLASIAATLLFYRLLFEETAAEGAPSPSWARTGAFAALTAVWANLHSLFAIVFPLAAAGLLGLLVRHHAADWLIARAPGAPGAFAGDAARAKRVAIALGAGGLASLLNPRGWEQHATFFTSSQSAAIWQVRDEWRAFNPFHFDGEHESLGALDWALTDVILFAFALAAIAGSIRFLRAPSAQRLRAVDPVLYAMGLAAVIAMLTSVRFLWLSVFPLLCLLRTARETGVGVRSPVTAALATVALAAVFPAASSWSVVRSTQPAALGAYLTTPYLGHKYGVAGVQFLRDAGIEGNLFNAYGAGGFYGYWLSPHLRTFVDGRTEHYAPEVFDDYLAIVRRSPAGDRDLDTLLADRSVGVFAGFGFPNDSPRHGLRYTAGHLLDHPDWVPVSRSTLHTIWLRRSDRTNLARVAAYYAKQGVPFDPQIGFDPERVLAEAPDWAIAHHVVPAGYRELDAAHRSGTASREQLRRLAIVLALAGAHERQLEVDLAHEEAHGTRPALSRRIVFALLRLGFVDEAYRMAEHLESLAPGDPAAAAVATTTEAYAFHRVRTQLQPDLPAPSHLLDRFPLLDPPDQQWILDAQRSLAVDP